MRAFIIRISLLLIVPALGYVLLFYGFRMKYEKGLRTFPSILLGDSQTEFLEIPNTYNRSVLGSPFFVQYEFVSTFPEALRGKKVYMAFNYHNLSDLYQNRLVNDSLWPGWRSNMLTRINDFNALNHSFPYVDKQSDDLPLFELKKLYRMYRSTSFESVAEGNTKDWVKDTLAIESAVDRHWFHAGNVVEDTIQRVYLRKTVALLQSLDCEVVLVKMPLTRFYHDRIPKDVIREYHDIVNDLGVDLLDLDKELSISSDYKYFKDYGHLNVSGDALVNEYLKDHFSSDGSTHREN